MVVASTTAAKTQWYYRFCLVVTGIGEEDFLPALFRSLASSRLCRFEVIRRIDQLTPSKTRLRTVGSSARISAKDEDLALWIRGYLSRASDVFILIVDDLEYDRRTQCEAVYDRYRDILNRHLLESDRRRASVHFLVNMLEAYYFAHPEAVTEALGLTSPFPHRSGDVEEIRNPKSEIRQLLSSEYGLDFDEIRDGERIVRKLELDIILSDPETCASLRTLVSWCHEKMEDHPLYVTLDWKERFHLEFGALFSPTRQQLRRRSE